MEKVIITCAITGSRITREQTPYIPITPEEIVDSAVKAYEAGAAIVHIHVRDRKTLLGSQDAKLFKEVSDAIKARCTAIQCLTTSGIPGRNLSEPERMAPIALNPELASVDLGTMNFGKLPYIVPEEFIERNLKEMLAHGVKPELEVFDIGMFETLQRMIKQNLIRKPYYIGLILGTPSGAQPNVQTVSAMLSLLPQDSVWFATGIGRHSINVAVLTMALGGHPRVGLEDSLYISAGELAKSNAAQVTKVANIAKAMEKEIATPDEARSMLGLKGIDKVNY